MFTDSFLDNDRVDVVFPGTGGIRAPGHALDKLPLAGFVAIFLGIACVCESIEGFRVQSGHCQQ